MPVESRLPVAYPGAMKNLQTLAAHLPSNARWGWLLATCAAFVTLCGAPGPAQAAESLRLGVAPFANKTGDARYDALSKGLADMLTTDLAHARDLQLVERERIAAVIAELKLGKSKWVDRKSAQRAGKLLGADLLLVGAVTAWAPTLRLDARMVSVETGEVMVTASAQGPQRSFFQVEAELARKLLKGFGVAVSPMLRMKIGKAPTRSFKALQAYSAGLDAHDKGDKAGAEKAYKAALSADPGFAAAQAQLQKLGKRVAALEKRTAAVERAGGLILKPKTAVEFWSNHKLYRARGDKAKARSAALAALRLRPTAVDALWRLCETAPEGQSPALKGAKVPAARVALVCALARNQGVAAARLSEALIPATTSAVDAGLTALGRDQVATAWLRLRALRPPANPAAGARLRAESVGLALLLGAALRSDAGGAALDAAFLDAAGRQQARSFVAATLAALATRTAPGKQRRGALYAHALTVRLVEHVGRLNTPPLLLQARFAEPSVADVTVQWGKERWQLVPRALPQGAEVAVWQVALRKPAPAGPTKLLIRWTDGDGVAQTDTRTWDLRITTNGRWRKRGTGLGARVAGRYPLLSTPFAPRDPADRGGRLLVDPVVGLWSAPLPQTLDRIVVQPMLAGEPSVWANGDLLDFARPAAGLKRLGLVRPMIYAGRKSGVRVLGSGRYYRETRGDEVSYVSETGTLRAERELQVRPAFTAPSVHVLGLATTRPAAALRAWRDAMERQPAPATLWELSTEAGLYAALWTACPIAKSRSKAVARLKAWVRLGADMRAARVGHATWAARLLGLCGDKAPFDATWAQAAAADANSRRAQDRWRYRAEVATARVLGHGWDGDPRLLAALRGAPGNSLEAALLTAAAVSAGRSRATAVQVRAVGTSFWLDRDEVSVDAYDACVRAGHCRELTDVTCAVGRGRDRRLASDPEAAMSSDFGGDQLTHCLPLERGMLPQNGVQHGDAARFCAWRGGALPTAAELRAAAQPAARGAGQPAWTGADDNLLDRVTCAWRSFRRKPPSGCGPGEAGSRQPWDRYAWIAPIGAHPGGESASGAAHLVGNLREWVRPSGSVWGCSFQSAPESPRSCLSQVGTLPTPTAADVGFRCRYKRAPKPLPRAKRGPARRHKSRPARGVRWAKIPAGPVQLGVDPKQPQGPVVSLAPGVRPTRAQVRALTLAVPGVRERDLQAFLSELTSLEITGDVSAGLVEELVARAAWTKVAPPQAFAAVVTLFRDLDGKPFKTTFETSVYVPGAKRRAKGDVAKTRALLWREMTRRLLREPRFPKPKGAPRWRKRASFDCGVQPQGACRDLMGTSGHRLDSSARPRPRQVVHVPAFRMMTHEVTQADFKAVMGREPAFFDCPGCAVERVSFADAADFCDRVGGRLPTEAEWARAAAGSAAPDATPLRGAKLDTVARYAGNTQGQPPKVGSRKANRYGVYDLLGGVWEWTADRWSDTWRLRRLVTGLKVLPRSRLRRAPEGSGDFCIRASRQERFAERNLDALPWVSHKRYWYACFATERAAEQARDAALAKAPRGPDPKEHQRPQPDVHAVRGGAWATDSRLVSRLARAPMGARLRSPFVGFRCAR